MATNNRTLGEGDQDRRQRAITPSRVGGGAVAANFVGGEIDEKTGNVTPGSSGVQKPVVGDKKVDAAAKRKKERESLVTGARSTGKTLQTQKRLDQIAAEKEAARARARARQAAANKRSTSPAPAPAAPAPSGPARDAQGRTYSDPYYTDVNPATGQSQYTVDTGNKNPPQRGILAGII